MLSQRKYKYFFTYVNIPALCLVCIFSGQPCFTQETPLIFTADFTKTLHRHSIEFRKPADTWLRIIPLEEDRFMRYNLVLQDAAHNEEIRIRIRPAGYTLTSDHPSVEAIRLAASIATNNPADSIIVRYPPDHWLQNAVGADWGMYFEFKPKYQFSEKLYGCYYCFYAASNAFVDIIHLSDHAFRNDLPEVPLIKFQGSAQEGLK